MKSVKIKNTLLTLSVCLCGWLFGQGLYEMMRPTVLVDAVSSTFVLHVVEGMKSMHSTDLQRIPTTHSTGIKTVQDGIKPSVLLMQV